MSDERWRVISRLYGEAAALAPVERALFLRNACGDDDVLRAEVESLLLDNTRVNGLLDPKDSRKGLLGQRIGGYEMRSLLGVGGMGEHADDMTWRAAVGSPCHCLACQRVSRL